MDAEARRVEQESTWPPHDCHDVLHHHFHNQDDAQWTTCGICGRIVAFQWKHEADAVAQAVKEERALWTCVVHGLNLVWCADCITEDRRRTDEEIARPEL